MLPFSALPFHCLTSQSLLLLFHAYQSLSVSLCAPPVISLPLLSSAQQNASMPCQFFALRLLALASQLESYLHLSIPFPLRSQRFRISRCYSHPCHSFSPQSCSVLFRFCLFACPIKSISDQRISVSFKVCASQFSSFSVHLYANPVLSQRLCCNAALIASGPSQVKATPFMSPPYCSIALLFNSFPCLVIACLCVISFCYPAHCFSAPSHIFAIPVPSAPIVSTLLLS